MSAQAEQKATRIKVSPRKEIRELGRLRRGFERSLESRLGRMFTSVADTAADNFIRSGSIGVTQEQIQKEANQILLPFYRSILKTFADRVLNNIGVKGEFEDLSRTYLSMGGMRIQNISDTTRRQIMAVVTRGNKDGLNSTVIAKNIREKGIQMSKGRARTIARTETHSASTFANNEMSKRYMPQQSKKMWVSTNDGRTRPHHRAMNGVEVDMDTDFTVFYKGIPYKMGYCGDPRGGAVNIINCRCQTIYIPPEADVEKEPMQYSEDPWIYSEKIDPIKDINEWKKHFDVDEVIPSYISDNAQQFGLSSNEQLAVYNYTTNNFQSINKKLRNWFYSIDEVNVSAKASLIGYQHTIRDAMHKMPKYKGQVARGIYIEDIDEFVAKNDIRKGSIYRTESIFSTTKKTENITRNVKYVITSKSGRDVSMLSEYDFEEEVLFPAGHQFEITKVERDGNSITITMSDTQDEVKQIQQKNAPISDRMFRKMRLEQELSSINNLLIELS